MLIFCLTGCQKSAKPESDEFTWIKEGKEIIITGYNGDETEESSEVVVPSELEDYPVTGIGKAAFAGQKHITSIELPDSITSIAEDAFEKCKKLKYFVVSSGSYAESWAKENGYEVRYATLNEDPNDEPTPTITTSNEDQKNESLFPSVTGEPKPTLTSNDPSIFTYSIINDGVIITGLKAGAPNELVIPAKIEGYPVTEISESAFVGQKNITSVELPGSITSIAKSAFSGCSSLTSVSMTKATKISGRAFPSEVEITYIED